MVNSKSRNTGALCQHNSGYQSRQIQDWTKYSGI